MAGTVPTATSLHDIYPDDAIATEKTRWEKLLAQFKQQYGRPAAFVSRSPGRVNIIGEVGPPSLFPPSLRLHLDIAANSS